jgi:hypothetical protein
MPGVSSAPASDVMLSAISDIPGPDPCCRRGPTSPGPEGRAASGVPSTAPNRATLGYSALLNRLLPLGRVPPRLQPPASMRRPGLGICPVNQQVRQKQSSAVTSRSFASTRSRRPRSITQNSTVHDGQLIDSRSRTRLRRRAVSERSQYVQSRWSTLPRAAATRSQPAKSTNGLLCCGVPCRLPTMLRWL